MKKKNTASRLRHRLTLQQEVQTSDGAGGYSKSWENVVEVWAEILPLASGGAHLGREILMAGEIQSEVTHRVLLRYREGVTAAMRLLYGERIFNIRFVANPEENNDVLSLLVHEGVAT